MHSFPLLFFLALPWIGSGIAEEQALAAASTVDAIYASAHEAFQDQDLLQAIPEESLQAALRDLKDFKTGVLESHSRGVEHVHDINNNPALATKLLVAAVRDLHKRQTPANGTTAGQPQNTPQQSSVASTQAPVQSTPQQSIQQTTQAQPPASGSEAPPAPTTTARPITTDGSTIVQTTQIQIPSQPTASIAITLTTTTTNPQASTFLTTYTPPPSPPAGKISSVVLLRTTTDADGQPSTITSYTLVDPAEEATGSTQAQNSAQATATQAGAGKPGLQTAGASRRRGGVGWVGCFGLWIIKYIYMPW